MKRDIRLLFVGGVYPQEALKSILSKAKANPQMAANNFQWGLIKGFDDNLTVPVSIMNELFIGSYPKNYKDPIIKSYTFAHTEGANDTNLGFINLAYIKQFIRPFGEKSFLKRWVKSNSDGAVFIYALTKKTIRVAKTIKKISTNTKIIVSVNDLPQHILKAKSNNIIASLWKQYQAHVVYSGLRYIDGYMLVAEKQREFLKIGDERCVVVEAITDRREYIFEGLSACVSNGIKNIVYTGTLAYQYNIMNLVNAFTQISDEKIRLIICGDGEAKNDIVKKSEIDKRIIYKGVIPKDEVYKLLHQAWVLVNPRCKGQSFTNYSFPIKTIDYLSAGRPVICQKLEAIPDEYDDHLIYFESSENDISLKQSLIKVLSLDVEEIERIGKSNVDFVNEYKTPQVQSRKILELFDRI